MIEYDRMRASCLVLILLLSISYKGMKGRLNVMETNSAGKKGNAVNVREMIHQKKNARNITNVLEKIMPKVLLTVATISILTTVGILYTLLSETFEFFRRVPIIDFFTGTVLKPLSQNPEFGVLPLLTGTIISSVIAMFVAIPIGLDDSHLFK